MTIFNEEPKVLPKQISRNTPSVQEKRTNNVTLDSLCAIKEYWYVYTVLED